MLYKRICCGVQDKGILVPSSDDTYSYIDDKDCYESLYLYNDEQKAHFDQSGSVAGIQDVVTNKLLWDFDSKDDIESAANDTLELIHRLTENGFKSFNVFFSGNKGFGVEVYLNKLINVKEFKSIVFKLAEDLPTFDRVVNNPSRVIRVPNTQHQESGLYKISITPDDLSTLSIEEILSAAKSKRLLNATENNDLPTSLLKPATPDKRSMIPVFEPSALSYENKPKDMSNCRWSLQNGFFKNGSRSTALLALASYYKNKGFDQEIVYRMLKGVAELQARNNDSDRFPDEEIYNNIIVQVFSDTWKNGQYSCREPGNWLYSYCKDLGTHACNHEQEDRLKPQTLMEVAPIFKDYVKNIEKNTVITGIRAIDENIFLSTGSNVLMLGAPASGKTALALEILSNTSKQGVKSVFASLDMHKKRLFEKVLYRLSNLSREDLYHRFQTDEEGVLLKKLNEEYGNVFFYAGSCPTVQDIRDYVLACQDQCGEKIKLVMVDYFERVTSDMSDDTAASKRVAGELQDLVNDLDVCLITLVQPNKISLNSGPDSPIYSYTSIKGSSFVYQAARQIISIWRPFAKPELKENDRYLQMAILKNDLGELNEFVFGWNGKRGEIRELEDHEFNEFEQLLESKERSKKADKEDW